MSIEYGFTKIRFTCNVYRPKSNYGTSACVIQDIIGNNLTSISGGNHFVCPTTGTKEHIINQPFIVADYITLNRYIDTRSNGNSTMKVELYDSYACKWITVLNTSNYRTGNGWENEKFKLSNAVASQPPVVDNTVPIKFHQGSAVHSVKLTRTRVTKPSMIFKKSNEILYGALVDKKPNYDTFIINYNSKKFYLINPIGLYVDPTKSIPKFYMKAECSSYGTTISSLRCIKVWDITGTDITKKCRHDFNESNTHCNYSWYSPSHCTDGNYDTWYGRYRNGNKHTIQVKLTLTVTPPPGVLIKKVEYCFGPQIEPGRSGGCAGWYDKQGKHSLIYTSGPQYSTKGGRFYSNLPANKIVTQEFTDLI